MKLAVTFCWTTVIANRLICAIYSLDLEGFALSEITHKPRPCLLSEVLNTHSCGVRSVGSSYFIVTWSWFLRTSRRCWEWH